MLTATWCLKSLESQSGKTTQKVKEDDDVMPYTSTDNRTATPDSECFTPKHCAFFQVSGLLQGRKWKVLSGPFPTPPSESSKKVVLNHT